MSFFDEAYSGSPPWDIGKPQPELQSIFDDKSLKGPILDIGCGTGENALYLASKGYSVTGIDVSPTMIQIAKEKTRQKGLNVIFMVHNAFALGQLNEKFNAIIDCQLFHTFDPDMRSEYIKNLHIALNSGGVYYMLVFSNKEPLGYGPRRISKQEILTSFQNQCKVRSIHVAKIFHNLNKGWAWAWLASITKL